MKNFFFILYLQALIFILKSEKIEIMILNFEESNIKLEIFSYAIKILFINF